MSYLEIAGVVIATTACIFVFWLYFKLRHRETKLVSDEDQSPTAVNVVVAVSAIDAEAESDRKMQEVEDVLVYSSEQEKYEYLKGLLIQGKYPETLKALNQAQREYSSTLFGRAVSAYTAFLREELEHLVDSALGDGGREAYLQAVELRDEVARPKHSDMTRLCFWDIAEGELALRWNSMLFYYEGFPDSDRLAYMAHLSEQDLLEIIKGAQAGDKVAFGLARYLVRWQRDWAFCELVAGNWLDNLAEEYPILSCAVRQFNEEDWEEKRE